MTAQFPAVVFPLLSSSDAMKELLECNNDTFPEHCALCAKQNGMKYLSISPCRYIYGRKSLKIPNFRFIIIYSMTVLSPTFSNKKLMGGGHPSFILSLSLLPPSCSAHIPRIIYFILFYIFFIFLFHHISWRCCIAVKGSGQQKCAPQSYWLIAQLTTPE